MLPGVERALMRLEEHFRELGRLVEAIRALTVELKRANDLKEAEKEENP